VLDQQAQDTCVRDQVQQRCMLGFLGAGSANYTLCDRSETRIQVASTANDKDRLVNEKNMILEERASITKAWVSLAGAHSHAAGRL
jgi:hypothetical protein